MVCFVCSSLNYFTAEPEHHGGRECVNRRWYNRRASFAQDWFYVPTPMTRVQRWALIKWKFRRLRALAEVRMSRGGLTGGGRHEGEWR